MRMFCKIVTSQARYKWPVTLLLWAALTTLVAMYTYLGNSSRFSNRSMQLIMKNLGHNLLILPTEANPLDTYLCTDKQTLFDQAATARMATHTHLASKYYTSILQQRLPVGNGSVILTGMSPVHRNDETREKGHLDKPVPPGEARLGAGAARMLNASAGDKIDLLGRSFRTAEVLEPIGSLDDYRVYIPLGDCQELLGKPGRINAILSFLCLHGTTLQGVSEFQKAEFAKLFPDFKIITKTKIAQGRYMARMTTRRYLGYLLAIVLCITVVMIAVTGLQEVSERRREVGIFLAMGASYFYIVALYLAKLLAIALAASGAGFLIGSFLSSWLLAPVLVTQTRSVTILWQQFPEVAILTCAVALLAELIPIAKLIRMNPNAILVEE